MISYRSFLIVVFLLLMTGVVASASVSAREAKRLAAQVYTPVNFTGDKVLPATLHRVVLLPVYVGTTVSPETAATIDEALFSALQRSARFEVVVLTREESRRWFGATEFSSAGALPHGYVSVVAAKFAADAVLFVDLTVFKPYRPLATGFRAKLIAPGDLEHFTWSFDEVISADVPGVANSARRQFQQTDRSDQPVDLSPAVLQNPSRFATFAATAMFQTLPPR